MSAASKRFSIALIVYLAWLGALGGLGVWSGRVPVVKAEGPPPGIEAR